MAAAAQTITTSLVVNFEPGDGGGILTAQIDDRETGFNLGETSFRPGDSPAFLVYKSSNVTISDTVVSYGSLTDLGGGSSAETELLSFEMTREVSPSKPISSNFASKWLGNDGGIVTNTETNILVPDKVVAVLKADYTANFNAYRISGVPTTLDGETTFNIIVYIAGTYI